MGRYHQLTRDERVSIETLLGEDRSQQYIASKLGRNAGTISRELQRNSRTAGYAASGAQRRAEQRVRGRPPKLLRPPRVDEPQGSPEWGALRDGLDRGWSPEQIAGRWREEHPESQLHHETLYRFIYSKQQRAEQLQLYLRQQHRARRKRSPRRAERALRKGMLPLSARPEAVNARLAPGHWEIDLMCFSLPGAVLLHMVERVSRFGLVLRLPGKEAQTLAAALARRLAALPRGLVKSFTCDRGTEFAELHQLKRKIYVCRAYAAWEKGLVEQQNGVLRHYLPRRTDLATLDQAELNDIRDELNDRPMKCLGFRTPREVLSSLTGGPVALHL
jgi:IS30 family transposase